MVSSEPNIPFRGTLKDVNKKSAEQECDKSFVMWFNHGIPITTIKCGEYSTIYSGKSDNGGVEKRYIKGEVTSVVINGDDDIKVNDKTLSDISTDVGNPTERELGTISSREAPSDTVKVYSFPLGEKNIDVYLPNQSGHEERTEYSLGHEEKIFYKGNANNSKYTLREDGNLVNSDQEVVLPKDPPSEEVTQESTDGTSGEDSNESNSTSSASKIMYAIPSFSAVLASMLLL